MQIRYRYFFVLIALLIGMHSRGFAQALPTKYTVKTDYIEKLGAFIKYPSYMSWQTVPGGGNFDGVEYKDVELTLAVFQSTPITRFIGDYSNGVNVTKINNDAYILSGYEKSGGPRGVMQYFYIKILNIRGNCYRYELRCNKSRMQYISGLKKLVYNYHPFKNK